jgi:hypothetical protein
MSTDSKHHSSRSNFFKNAGIGTAMIAGYPVLSYACKPNNRNILSLSDSIDMPK